ncbi:hypothetical protein C8F04DRAFT_879718, partial [Mycena alexandri]
WPLKLNWGLLLGCDLVKFRSGKAKLIPHKQRIFALLVTASMQLIWRLRNEPRFDKGDECHKVRF